jgi:hypothetical protein
MLRLLESDIYTLFVGLTFDVLVAEQLGGHGTRGLSGEISYDVTGSSVWLCTSFCGVNGVFVARRVMEKPRRPCGFWKTKPSQMFFVLCY